MRFFMLAALYLSLSLVASSPADALAQQADKASVDPSSTAFATQAQRLDKLFDALKREANPDAAKGIANQIRREWQDSGSATVNLLMQWTDKAVDEDKNAAALDYLDEAIRLRPDYVEGWNRRATLHFGDKDFDAAILDLRQVLAREPRHFGALVGLGLIMQELGEDKRALELFRKAVAVYPRLPRVPDIIKDLAEKVEGRPI